MRVLEAGIERILAGPATPAKCPGVVTCGLVVSCGVIRSLQKGMGTVKQVAAKQRSRIKALAALLLGGVLAFCLAAPAWGVVVNNLYDAVVEVPNTGEQARRQGFEQALAQVLVRLTGSREVLETLGNEPGGEGGGALLGRGAELVDAYSYRRDGDTLELHVSVSGAALGRALAERKVSVWGANRPGVLVWFVVDDRGRRELVHRDATLPPFLEKPMQPLDDAGTMGKGPWKGPLMKQATLRGVPLFLPFNDEEDRRILNLSEIWGLFPEPIEEASQRYAPDRIAVVRVSRQGEGWRARWVLRQPFGRTVIDGVVEGSSRKEVAESLMDRWASHFARVFAVDYSAERETSDLALIANNVDSLADYASIRRALMRMEPIRSVEPQALKRDQLHLAIRYNGDLPLVRDYIALDKRFRLMAGPADGSIGPEQGVLSGEEIQSAAGEGRRVLYYQWQSDDGGEELESVDDGDPLKIVPLSEPASSGEEDAGMPSM